MSLSVLGPLVVDGDDSSLGPRDRVVLAALAVQLGEVVRAEELADALWGEAPPASWAKVVQGCVVRLRKQLGAGAIETAPNGYRLVLPADAVDATRFQRLVERSRELTTLGEPERAAYLLGEALALWRGRAFTELDGWAPGRIEAARLDDLRLDVQEAYLEAALAAGQHREVLAEVQTRVAESPLREHRWALLARTQYQCGRQGEALRSLHEARSFIVEELGVEPGPELVALEQAILRHDASLAVVDADPEPATACPYLGLVPYDIDDADGFFGRTGDVDACLRRLDDVGAVTVVGPSGSGKSSLVRAGIGASLRRDGHRVVVITPGARPMDALTVVPGSGQAPVLVVDQCEEVVTLCPDPIEQERFFAALAAHADRGRLVVAIRADHLGNVVAEPSFARLVERSVHLLGTMEETQLREAIEEPARQAGLLLEPGLVDLLVREVEGEPGALPLLSHALHQTWQRREGRTLTVAGYRASGGIREAVGRSAEAVYEHVPEERRLMLRDLLLRLVIPTPEGEPVRSRVSLSLVAGDPARQELVDLLVDARLLTTNEDGIELAHESVARAWPRMREWLDEDVEGQRILRHLSTAAAAWEAMDRPASELYRGARLARALEWRDAVRPDLTPMETALLDASHARETADLQTARLQIRKERRTVRRLRALVTAVATLAVVAAGASIVAVDLEDRANERATVAEGRRLAAQALVERSYDRALLLGVEAIHVWDSPETRGNLVTTIERSPGAIGVIRSDGERPGEARVSPAGDRIAVADNADDVTLYDIASRRPLGELADDETSYRMPVFSPDGSTLAVARFATSCSTTSCPHLGVELVDAADLSSIEVYEGLGAPARDIAFSPDGTMLAAVPPFLFAGPDDNIAVWRVGEPDEPLTRLTLEPRGTNRRHTPDSGPPGWVRFGPDGTMLYASGAGPTVAFDVATGKAIRSFDGLGGLALSSDGRTIAIATETGTVRLVDTTTGGLRAELNGHDAAPVAATFSPDGSQLATASTDETAAVWEVASGERIRVLEGHSGTVSAVDFDADASTLFTTGADRTVMIWDLAGSRGLARQLRPPSLPSGIKQSIHVAPTGDRAAFLSDRPAFSEPIRVISTADDGVTELSGETGATMWAAHLRDERLVTVGRFGEVQLFDTKTGELLASQPGRGEANWGAIAALPDADKVVVADADGTVTELDASTLEPTGRTVETGISPEGIRATHGGVIAVTASSVAPEHGSQVVFADLDAGRVLRRMDFGGWGPRANFSRDGRRYALGGFDGRLGVVDVATGAMSGPDEPVHEGPISGVAFSPDGATLASLGFDGQVLLADAATGALQARIRPGRPNVEAGMTFLDDGRTLVVAYGDGSMLSYDTDPSAWISHACAVAGRNLTHSEWRTAFGDRAYRKTCPGNPG